jgi:hypothetical protein
VLSDGSGCGDAGIEEQTRPTMRNVEAALRGADCTLEDVIDMTVWLRDPRDFTVFNRTYAEFFVVNKPTRTVLRADFIVRLPDRDEGDRIQTSGKQARRPDARALRGETTPAKQVSITLGLRLFHPGWSRRLPPG